MSSNFTIRGKYTGSEYLVTIERVDEKYLVTVYDPAHWSISEKYGLSYYPSTGKQFRGRWLRLQHHLARRGVRRIERSIRLNDRRQARIARVVGRETT